MTTKKKEPEVLNAEERFFLNLDEDLTLEVDYEGFVFTLKVPDMMSEAALSLGALRAARTILSSPEYTETLQLIKFPRLKTAAADSETPDQMEIEEIDIDLTKLTHVRFAASNMTESFVNMMNDVAYIEIIVKNITYNGKEVWVTVDGEDKHIKNFHDFIKYVRTKKLRLTQVIDHILKNYYAWLQDIEVDPQEVKN